MDIRDGSTVWRFDTEFLESNWTCIWGRGCQGILAEPAEHLGQGCCSVGADLGDVDEAMDIAANAAMLDPARFQYHAEAAASGIFRDETRLHTRVVDGACIFLNRPGFAGGAGCALHLAAGDFGETPLEWKPSVCWQVPVRVEWTAVDGDTGAGDEIAHVRRWTRADWGDDEPMAWWCTEAPQAYVGDRPVVESLAAELIGVVGEPVYVELRRRLDGHEPSRLLDER
jgi:hypothetical protein